MSWFSLFPDPRLGGKERSPKWEEVRGQYRKKNPLCAVCGNWKVEIHHIKPFHLYPELELDESNFISLCEVHHFWFGHLGSYKSFNESVREDSKIWNEKIKSRK